jgi:hypothetical protein
LLLQFVREMGERYETCLATNDINLAKVELMIATFPGSYQLFNMSLKGDPTFLRDLSFALRYWFAKYCEIYSGGVKYYSPSKN